MWPVLLMGRNSVTPSTTAKITAFKTSMRVTPILCPGNRPPHARPGKPASLPF